MPTPPFRLDTLLDEENRLELGLAMAVLREMPEWKSIERILRAAQLRIGNAALEGISEEFPIAWWRGAAHGVRTLSTTVTELAEEYNEVRAERRLEIKVRAEAARDFLGGSTPPLSDEYDVEGTTL